MRMLNRRRPQWLKRFSHEQVKHFKMRSKAMQQVTLTAIDRLSNKYWRH